MPKKDTASTVKPHTEAKLQFYTRYLERYLKILLRTSAVDKINIYDMFCGEGIYSDGNTGSAVRAVDAIWKAKAASQVNKLVNLHLNDLDNNKVEKLKQILLSRNSEDKKFHISYSTYEAFELLNELANGFARQGSKIRNLIFVDPYGYKAIQKNILERVLLNGKTEVILFLPIEQMYRFRNMTKEEIVESSYQPLKQFIEQFDLDVSGINSEKEFIQAFTTALVFSDRLYATSYAIKNHTGHYYGMFFITPNLKGFEKIIEVKWALDSQQGEESGVSQKDFFLESEKQGGLEKQLKQHLLSSDRTNAELYEFVLKLGFLPKHANDIFRRWQKEAILEIYDLIKNKPARKGTFKLNYQDSQSNKPLLKFCLS